MSILNLKKFIKEEIIRLSEESQSPSLNKILNYGDYKSDPEKSIVNLKALRSAGVPSLGKGYTYHVVYGKLVAEKDAKDVFYWSNGDWQPIDEKQRHHPVSVHNPSSQ
jgi:hypothetical protein